MDKRLINPALERFKTVFKSEPEHIFLSPGRINIIGGYIDFILRCTEVQKLKNELIPFSNNSFNRLSLATLKNVGWYLGCSP